QAAKEVGKLLRPLDDEQNEHKQKQLRELALINGTLREEDYCNICGEKGHRQFECPKRAQTRSATVEVRCALCGDTSHPTRDCLLHKSKAQGQPGHEASLDKEYMSFMAELGDGDGGGSAGAADGAPLLPPPPQPPMAPPVPPSGMMPPPPLPPLPPVPPTPPSSGSSTKSSS
ncbi:unnamed protein product, partial [Ectocarpus sp. 12 AP-2014]